MLTDPSHVFVYLVVLIGFLYWVGSVQFLSSFFKYLPQPIWIYFLPMVSSYLGIIPHDNALYEWARNYLLPAGLILMLLSANLPAILHLGPRALGVMLFGSTGIVLGSVIAFSLFQFWLPPESWKAIGSLSASWIGGSANMIAVAKSVDAPDSLLGPMIVVDTVVGYGWMGIVIALAVLQPKFDAWGKVDATTITSLNTRMKEIESANRRPTTIPDLISMLAIGFGVGYVALHLGTLLPPVGVVLNAFGWTVLLTTIIGAALSLTRISRLEYAGASHVGSIMFYLLLATIGARADITGILEVPLFAAVGVTIIIIHALTTLIGGRLLRAPMFLLATSSQANIGGPVTAPIVASVYQSSLAMVGLLLAVLGNLLGVAGGLVVAQVCHWIGG